MSEPPPAPSAAPSATGDGAPDPEPAASLLGVDDLLAPGLGVVFCGINPGVASGRTGHHFARPGNRFWRLLALAGFTDRIVAPTAEHELLGVGVGVTNLVERVTRGATDLTTAELRAGVPALEAKVARLGPGFVAVLGIGAYRSAFRRPAARIGPQTETLGGARLWLLANPSGLQARYPLEEMAGHWRDLHRAVEASLGPGRSVGPRR